MIDFTKGQLDDATVIGAFILNRLMGFSLLSDTAGADAMGLVDANPGALTLLGRLKDITTALTSIDGHVDGLEGYTDNIEALITATNTALGNLSGTTDGLEGLIASTNTLLTAIGASTDGLETLIASTNTALALLGTYVDGLEASAASQLAATATIGTRHYGAPHTRLTYTNGASSATTDAIGVTEVLLHNCGAGRCFVNAGGNAAATAADIPLEAGEKFHLRILVGDKIAAWGDGAGGNLNISPVA